MKCKVCGGTGTSNTCVNGTFKPCTFCDGTGEYEPFDLDVELDKLDNESMTNEEWFDTLSTTEEKAEAIYECVMANSWSFNKDGIKRWLQSPKEEHKDA